MRAKKASRSIYKRIVIIVLIPFLVLLMLLLALYSVYAYSMRQQATAAFDTLAEQRIDNIEDKLAYVQSVAGSIGYSQMVQQYLVQMDAQERVDNYSGIRQTFNMILNTDPVLCGIYISDKTGVFLDSGNGFMYLFDQANAEYGIREQGVQHGFFTRLYSGKSTDYNPGVPHYCIYYMPIGVITPISRETENGLYCAVIFDIIHLLDMDSGVEGSLEAFVWENSLVSSNMALTPTSESALIRAADRHSARTMDYGGAEYYLYATPTSTQNGLNYIFLVSADSLAVATKVNLRFILIMGAGCTVAMLFLLVQLRRSISEPIQQIAADMKQITLETTGIEQSSIKELDVFTSGVNQMLAWLHKMQRQEMDQRERVYQLNLRRTQAEMLAYRSQINPHFLMNTLETMGGMARYYRVGPLEELVTAMGESFRYTLRAPDLVPLEKEIAHMKNYMRIMEIRSPGKYHLMLKAEEETLNISVLSLMLQPLAENAVEHGFDCFEKDAACTMLLSTWIDKEKNRLHIQLVDNGNGMSEEDLTAVRKRLRDEQPPLEKHHIALNNIFRRLKIVYGNHSHMVIRSKQGFYTSVEICIPLDKEPDADCGLD